MEQNREYSNKEYKRLGDRIRSNPKDITKRCRRIICTSFFHYHLGRLSDVDFIQQSPNLYYSFL